MRGSYDFSEGGLPARENRLEVARQRRLEGLSVLPLRARLFAAAGVAGAATIGPSRANAGQFAKDAVQLADAGGQQAELAPGHFSPKGKLPSQYTVEAQQHQRKVLPFNDKQDFDEADRGF